MPAAKSANVTACSQQSKADCKQKLKQRTISTCRAQSKRRQVHPTTRTHVLLDAANERVTSALGVTLGLRADAQTRKYKQNPTATSGCNKNKHQHYWQACFMASQSNLCTTSVHPCTPPRYLHRSNFTLYPGCGSSTPALCRAPRCRPRAWQRPRPPSYGKQSAISNYTAK